MRAIYISLLAGAALIAGGCEAEPGDQAELERPRAVPDRGSEMTADASAAPDTTEEALWRFLQEEEYRDEWSLWPGTDRLYEGTEPHGMLLTTYVNEIGRDALSGGIAAFPAGAVIVKENYMPDSSFAAATVMYKVDGYNPDHDDWLFAKYDDQGVAEVFGRADGCQACHQQAENAYIYTSVER